MDLNRGAMMYSLKCVIFQQKNYETCKKKIKMAHKQEKTVKRNDHYGAQMLDLADKGFKATIINMLKDLQNKV